MKIIRQRLLQHDRRGMSRTKLLVGLGLWVAVFASLYFMNPRVTDPTESGSTVQSDEDAAPIIVDQTNPDQASASTVKFSFPARPLPDFELQNSEGGTLGLKDLKGKRWVASFVFSRCASTCPMISAAMMKVHDRVEGKADDVMFITITVDPKFDTPEVFEQYAKNFRPKDSSRWKFLTGDQQEIYELIVNGFGLYVAENLGEDRMAGFEVAHTNRVVLVNEDAIPVGTFLGTREEDMIKLRRILTGNDDFPEPGPALTFGSPNGQPLGLSFELVSGDDETGDDKSDSDDDKSGDDEARETGEDGRSEKGDSDSNGGPAKDGQVEDGGGAKAASETAAGGGDAAGGDAGQQSGERNPPTTGNEGSQAEYDLSLRTYFLTTVAGRQDDSAADASADQEAMPAQKLDTAENSELMDPEPANPELTVAEFNESLQSRLPDWAKRLPTWNAALNSLSTVLLLMGYAAIRKKRKIMHRNLMISAFLVSAAFLISYLSYHYALGEYTGEHGRRFAGTGIWATLYPWVLWPHVILAVFVPVLGLRVFQLAFREDWEKHRRLARVTFPIWLYVSVTGVMIYGMLYHWPDV